MIFTAIQDRNNPSRQSIIQYDRAQNQQIISSALIAISSALILINVALIALSSLFLCNNGNKLRIWYTNKIKEKKNKRKIKENIKRKRWRRRAHARENDNNDNG